MKLVITGMGLVGPLGADPHEAFARLLRGDVGIRRDDRWWMPGMRSDRVGAVDDAGLEAGDRWSRAERMAVTAARAALADRSEGPRRVGPRTALIVGGTTGGIAEAEEALARLTADPDREEDEAVLRNHVLTAPTHRVAVTLGPFGWTTTLCSACSGGANALVLGAAAIRSGRFDAALCGGVDALGRMTLAGFSALAALDPAPCRPFDATRAGLSLGEAAAFLLLESDATAGTARVYAELAGYAVASEAHHITQPEAGGEVAAAVMRSALARAGLSPSEVGYVSAHGTATPHNDPMEAAAIRRTFVEPPPTSSVKGSLGHSLAASGAVEAIVSALVVQTGQIPPTTGLESPDPRCALPHVLGGPHVMGGPHAVGASEPSTEWDRGAAVVSNAFGFGGTDTALVIAAPRDRPTPEPPRSDLVITAAESLGGELSAPDAPVRSWAPLSLEPLDPMRARRFDRAARLTTVAAQRALVSAGLDGEGAKGLGIVVGSAFGSVGATGTFLRRLFEKGVRFASPAHFPNALPSSLASQASIYLGLQGPALSCSDLCVSGEAAVAVASLLVLDGVARAMLAVAGEEQSVVAERVSSPLISGLATRRGEGAAALVIERAEDAAARGKRPLCRLTLSGVGTIASPPRSRPRGEVVSARAPCPIPPAWREAPHRVVTRAGADHESAGAVALALAARRVGAGEVDEVLVVGESLGEIEKRRYAYHLARSHPSPADSHE